MNYYRLHVKKYVEKYLSNVEKRIIIEKYLQIKFIRESSNIWSVYNREWRVDMWCFVHSTIIGLELNVGERQPHTYLWKNEQEFMGELNKIPTCHMPS